MCDRCLSLAAVESRGVAGTEAVEAEVEAEDAEEEEEADDDEEVIEDEEEEELPCELLFELLSATPTKDAARDRAARRPLPGFAAMNAFVMSAMIACCFATVLLSRHSSESSTGGVIA